MRICFDTRLLRTSNLEGVGGYTLELLSALLKIDKENRYVLPFESLDRLSYFKKVFNVGEYANIELIAGDLTPSSVLVNLFYLPRFLKKNKVDIYHSPFFAFMPLKHKFKVISTVDDLIPFIYPRYSVRDCPLLKYIFMNRGFAKFITSKSDMFAMSSEYTRKFLVKDHDFTNERSRTIYPGINERFMRITDNTALDSVLQKYGLPKDYILFMGELGLHKNITNLIKGYLLLSPALKKKHKLVIIGRGETLYPKDIDKIVTKGKIHDDIIMPGFIHIDDKPAIYSAARAFVSPTLYEGFPSFILEAMACGTPVAASNIPQLEEFVGDSIVRFEPARPETITIALEKLLSSEPLQKELSEKGRSRASEFTWDRTARQVLALYKELV